MLGYMAMNGAPPYQTAFEGIDSGCLSLGFPWWDGPSGVGGFSEVVLERSWDVNSPQPSCLQGKSGS
jgi:hypothetical protein